MSRLSLVSRRLSVGRCDRPRRWSRVEISLAPTRPLLPIESRMSSSDSSVSSFRLSASSSASSNASIEATAARSMRVLSGLVAGMLFTRTISDSSNGSIRCTTARGRRDRRCLGVETSRNPGPNPSRSQSPAAARWDAADSGPVERQRAISSWCQDPGTPARR
jgi:hypothetical protein